MRLKTPKKTSRRERLRRLKQVLEETYTFGHFDSIAANLGIEEPPPREEQVEMLHRCASEMLGVQNAKMVHEHVTEHIRMQLCLDRTEMSVAE